MVDAMAADSARNDELILVDLMDREVGSASKERAHFDGILHRAFSVVLTQGEGDERQILLSKRALCKYHSGGLWTNSCCSHPRKGERVLEAAKRRLPEELGVVSNDLCEIGSFAYRAAFNNGIVEFEYDHVLIGTCSGEFDLDPTEVSDVRWVGVEELVQEYTLHPEEFSAWAPMVFSMVLQDW